MEWEKMFADHVSDIGLIPEIYMELMQFNSKIIDIDIDIGCQESI